MIGGTSGSETKLCQPCSSQSKTTQTRSASEGSRKTIAPFEPCCLRFSAPCVEKMSRKRSRSSTCVVARSMSLSFRVACSSGLLRSADESWSADYGLLRVDRSEAVDNLKAAASGLGDVHVQTE